jgi:ankyrin repeat protein
MADFWEAIARDDVREVERLLDKGAAIDEKDRCWLTALWKACEGGHLPMVRLLLDRGADSTGGTEGRRTPLTAAS